MPDPFTTTVTLTATDPEGLSASVTGDFLTNWDSEPALLSTEAGPREVVLTFDQAVQANLTPSRFTVNVVNGDGSAGTVGVSGVSVDGAVVTLELASALKYGQTVTLDYAHDDEAPLQRVGGDPAPGFTGQAVEVSIPHPCAGGGPRFASSIRVENTFYVNWATPIVPAHCTLTGFIVELQGEDGTQVREQSSDPTLTSMTLQVPGPAEYLVMVYATYVVAPSNPPETDRRAARGNPQAASDLPRRPLSDPGSDPPRRAFQNLGANCVVVLTLKADVDYGVTGTWTGFSQDCENEVRILHKRPARTAWDASPWSTRKDRARRFIYGGLDPVAYEFFIQFKDTTDLWRFSPEATVTVRDVASAAPQVGRAENVRLVMRNDKDPALGRSNVHAQRQVRSRLLRRLLGGRQEEHHEEARHMGVSRRHYHSRRRRPVSRYRNSLPPRRVGPRRR